MEEEKNRSISGWRLKKSHQRLNKIKSNSCHKFGNFFRYFVYKSGRNEKLLSENLTGLVLPFIYHLAFW